jgi:hypothetical protein
MKSSDLISDYFTFGEVVFSERAARLGIDNTPSQEVFNNAVYAAGELDELRRYINRPIFVSSWHRCEELNKQTPGSSSVSDHMTGFAIDCKASGMTPKELCDAAVEYFTKTGQKWNKIIHEYGSWMHISFHPDDLMQTFTIFSLGSGVKPYYAPGILTQDEYMKKARLVRNLK